MSSSAPALRKLKQQLPSGVVQTAPEVLQRYRGDKWYAEHLPDAVCLPRTSADVSKILKLANVAGIPVTPRGAGYGYVGGCVPIRGGIVLSLERLNRIKEINADDFVAVVQPAVITKTLQDRVEKMGRFYPPDPASRADCSIGGNIATNAGGPRCLKYGVTRDYVLGLEVVLADGALVRLGSRTHKNKSGFDLSRLFVGSEGMLGIVTEATLKLLPLPPSRSALAIGFASMPDAIAAIKRIFAAGLLPCALELADQFTLAAARKRTGSERLTGCEAHIIVEIDGHEASLRTELDTLAAAVAAGPNLRIERAVGAAACEELWQLRREFSFSLRDTGLTKLNEDIVVPRSRLGDLFKFTATLEKKHGFAVACFGHAGDGNIHVNIMLDMDQPGARAKSEKALDALFKKIISLEGVITGEHGIGLAKKKWWPESVGPAALRLHHTVKDALDPKHILNPGKFLG